MPFRVGGSVKVIILRCVLPQSGKDSYPLPGKLVEYIPPTEPVAQDSWSNLH